MEESPAGAATSPLLPLEEEKAEEWSEEDGMAAFAVAKPRGGKGEATAPV